MTGPSGPRRARLRRPARACPGRGTFVARAKIDVQVRLSSYTEEMGRRGMKAGARTLLARIESAGPGVARALEIPEGAKVVHWQRLRLADGAPMRIEDAYLADSIVPNFLDQPLPESLYDELRRRDLLPTWGEDSSTPRSRARRRPRSSASSLASRCSASPAARSRQHRDRGLPLDVPGRPLHAVDAALASQHPGHAQPVTPLTGAPVPVVDGHNDLPWTLRDHCGYDLAAVDLVGGEPRLHTDVPRLARGGSSASSGRSTCRATHRARRGAGDRGADRLRARRDATSRSTSPLPDRRRDEAAHGRRPGSPR